MNQGWEMNTFMNVMPRIRMKQMANKMWEEYQSNPKYHGFIKPNDFHDWIPKDTNPWFWDFHMYF
tara:strand:- start:351 stop:545 length:195 start_codon:yes stop_codon:yes gene_type:complete